MSDNSLKIDVVNKHFEEYIKNVKKVQENIKEESEYHRGYLDCVSLVSSAIASGEELPDWLKSVKEKIEMDERSKVVSELMNGITPLAELYKKLSDQK
jgi:RNA binding exosome subunit